MFLLKILDIHGHTTFFDMQTGRALNHLQEMRIKTVSETVMRKRIATHLHKTVQSAHEAHASVVC